jgi:hypothetical protein
MLFSGAWGKIIHEKDLKQILQHCPFKENHGDVAFAQTVFTCQQHRQDATCPTEERLRE